MKTPEPVGEAWARPDPGHRPQFNELGPRARRQNVPTVYLLWLVALFVYILDRWSKTLVLGSFMPGESRTVVPHLLWWTYVQNTHGAFGLFGNSPYVLIVLALIVLGVFAYAFRDAVRHSNVVRIAFGMIAGGAIGNIVDRFQHKWVVDFIDFRTIWPNVFNVADACITTGVILLILASLRREKHA